MGKRLESLQEIAYKEALKATGKQKHGAVVAAGDRVLAKACNNYANGCHAETRAIRRVAHDALPTATILIVVRLRKSQKFGLSKPCSECEKAIQEANIEVVYYSTDDNALQCETYGSA
jgi:pyrimidine deaminase RibD-like protein